MATFVWDLGFDCNAAPDLGNIDNQPYLQNGFVVLDDTGNVPTTPVGIQPGDVIHFNVFNTTVGAGATTDFSISGGTIQLQNAESSQQSQPSPFEPSPTTTIASSDNIATATMSIASLGSTSLTGPSVIFGPVSPNLDQFPIWVDILGGLTIANAGRFLMNVSLDVVGPNGSQTFVADPEMVVGGPG